MPLTAPITDGLPYAILSRIVQTSSATAVAVLVLSTAAPASALAKYGSPPLKPFQPIHRMPAPTRVTSKLFGGKWSRAAWRRGRRTRGAVNPEAPARKGITYPPEKSATPKVASQPPPQRLNAPTV